MSHPGMTRRVAYERSAYVRKAYTRSDGTHVSASKVPATHVPATWVPTRGAPAPASGHKKKVLVTAEGKSVLSEDMRHLSPYGYSFSKAEDLRHAALRKAVKDYGEVWAIRRLNAISILQKNASPAVHAKAEKDKAYVQHLLKEKRAKA